MSMTLGQEQRQALSIFAQEYRHAEVQLAEAMAAIDAATARLHAAYAVAGLREGDRINFTTGEVIRDEQLPLA